ncbi:MAG: hypothetical protein V4591_00120 [Bdellovibrionota bacterium]
MQFFLKLFLLFLTVMFLYKANADNLNVIELNLLSSTATISLSDTSCHFLLDNSTNYAILPKSENKNIFEVSALKINQTSATVIFTCKNGEYVYQIRYTNTSPILRSYNSYSYDQRKNSYGAIFGYSPDSAMTQSFQLNDNSYNNLFFQFNHTDLDLKNGYYSNDFQARYNGNYLDEGLANNSTLGLELSNGMSSLGRFDSYQATTGLYGYNFTLQQLKYAADSRPTNTLSLYVPLPFTLQLSYLDKSDGSKEYVAQKISTVNFKNIQSNNIITYDKVQKNSQEQVGGVSSLETLSINNFSNYFFNSFVYQQINFNAVCSFQSNCSLTNAGTSYNYQDQEVVSKVGYNPIPNQLFLYYQHYFWQNSDVIFNYSKTYSPIASLQNNSVTKTTSQSSLDQFYSIMDARILKENWLYTLTLPLLFVNTNSYAIANVQYNSENIGAFCNYQISQTHQQNWENFTWNVSVGLNYFPNYGFKQAVNTVRSHKLYGYVLSNMSTPEENATVLLALPGGKTLSTKANTEGKYAFDDVPVSGNFSLTAKKNSFEDTVIFRKDLDVVAQQKDIQIPTYMLVNVHFILLTRSGTHKKEIKEELPNIVNQQMEFNVVTASLKAIYSQNKIFIRRDGFAKFEVHPEFLPFKYVVKKMSMEGVDTVKNSEVALNVYLVERI